MSAPEAEALAEQGRVLTAIQRIQDFGEWNPKPALILLRSIRDTADRAIRKLEKK